MVIELNKFYINIQTGCCISPLFSIIHPYQYQPNELFICLIGYDSNSMHHYNTTSITADLYNLSMGSYDDVLTIHTKDMSDNWVETNNFTPILSLKNFKYDEIKLELNKCYYNDKSKQIIKIVKNYKEHFLYVNDCLIIFDYNSLKVFSNSESYFFNAEHTFISNFNNYDDWVEVPNLFYDISIGKYGTTTDEIQQTLYNYKRKKLIKKLCSR